MRVLIAYDGSAGAEQSLRLADSIDWPAGSTLRIASVIEPTLSFVGAPMAGGFDIPPPEVDAEITAYQQEQVTKAAESLRSADRTVEGIVLRGRPATALVDEATRFGADLVMGGSRGHGTISRLLLGSVSAEVVDQRPMSRPHFAHPVDQSCHLRHGRLRSLCGRRDGAIHVADLRGTADPCGQRRGRCRAVAYRDRANDVSRGDQSARTRPCRGQGRAHAHRRRDDRAASGARAASRSGHPNGRRGRGDHRRRSRCGRRSRGDGLAWSNWSCERRPWQRGPERVVWQHSVSPSGSRIEGSGGPGFKRLSHTRPDLLRSSEQRRGRGAPSNGVGPVRCPTDLTCPLPPREIGQPGRTGT